ncbi:hypothetical protein Tco_0134892 [Tanacetum coccineum]
MGQLNEFLVKSLQTEFSKILSAHDFSSSLPTELKDLPSKFNELTKEVKGLTKQVHKLEIELLGDLKEIPSKLEEFTKLSQAKLKTLDALPSLLKKVTNALNQFSYYIASKKTRDTNVPVVGQAGTQPVEGEKNTNQATISQLFQRKDAKNANLTKQQSKPIPPIITTTTQMQSPFQSLPKSSSQPEGEHIKKDKGKRQCLQRRLRKKKFDFITEDGKHIHLTEEQINQQKKIEEEAKAEVAKHEGEANRRAESRITNCDVLTKKGPITLKMYREDGTSEVIPNFKYNDLHLGEWREVVKACRNRARKGWKTIYGQIQTRMDYLHITKAELGINLDIPLSEQDSLDKLNDLANKKRKHDDDIHD